jgi:integrase
VRKVRPVKHHPALPFDQAPVFMADLATRDTISAKALRFTILTAARTSESRFATWPEIDLGAATWTLPAERTKTNQEHVVPLSAPVVELLRELKAESDGGEYVFSRAGEPVSENAMLSVIGRMSADRLGVGLAAYVDPKRNSRVVTTHGFRSSFRDWAAETTSFQGEVVEMALAHAVSDEVEGAYRRGTLLKKRRELMDAWAAYCAGPRVGNVVSLPRAV